MDIATILAGLIPIGLSFVRFIVGILLFCLSLPHRDNFAARAAAAIAVLFAVDILLSIVFFSNTASQMNPLFYTAQLVVFSLLLLAFVAGTILVFDINVWTALFCCSAGYTVQNLASGATELIWSLMGGIGTLEGASFTPGRLAIAFICTTIVYVATYFLITRTLMKEGFRRVDDHLMLIMMAVTILVIIGFDLLIKGLAEWGIPLESVVALRIFHGLACIFTLTMEFELLIRRRLEAERDTLNQVLVEHERQYALARDNVHAINARVHDIRHLVGRLADEGGVDTTVLRDMVRAVDVYDSNLHTGCEALDVAISERRLSATQAGVTLACIADGKLLAFMDPADVYVLVTALVDAALTVGGKALSFTVQERMGAAVVRLTWQGEAPQEIPLAEVHEVTQRYGGTCAVQAEGDSQYVSLLFPVRS